ncbi:MAG: class I SAM-dependent methyltransferase [Actinomycetota bacterium]
MRRVAQPGVQRPTTPDARQLAAFYSSGAHDYRRLWSPQLLGVSRPLLDELPWGEARLVLDVGTGVGALLPEVKSRAPAATVVGIDVAEGMLALGPRSFPLAVMDATRLAFKERTYDLGLFAFVLFHLPSPLTALRNMARALKRGGTVATITWGDDPRYPAYDVWSEELDRLGAAPALGAISRHDLVDTPAKLEAMFAEAGFVAIRTWMGTYENRMTSEKFMQHRLGHGMSRYRFESLAPDGRRQCLARVSTRLEDLSAEDFVDRAEVVYAVGRAH